MFLVVPYWPRVGHFPRVTALLAFVNLAVFAIAWPLEKSQSARVSREDLVASARALADVLARPTSGLDAESQKYFAVCGDEPDFPNAAVIARFEAIQSRASLTARAKFDWDQAYPRFEGYLRSVEQAPASMSFYRRWGFHKDRPWNVTLITHLFLHAGIWHLLGNLLFLWAVGGVVEEKSPRLLLATYGLGGAGAAIAQMAWAPTMDTLVGASGAVSALLGLGLTVLSHGRVKIFYVLAPVLSVRWGTFESPLWFFLPLWLFDQLLMAGLTQGGATVHIGFAAHLGGFVVGAVMGLLYRLGTPKTG